MPATQKYYGGRYEAPKPRKKLRSKDLDLVGSVIQASLGQVDDVSSKTMTRFMPELVRARDELLKKMHAWRQKEQGSNRFTMQRHRNALVQINRVLGKSIKLHPEMARQLKISMGDVSATSIATLEHELGAFAGVFEGSIQPINIEAGAVVASQEQLMLKRFESSAKRYAGGIRDQVVSRLAQGILGNQTVDEVAQRMMREIPKVFDGATHKAERLVRTEMMNTYNSVHRAGIIEAAEEDEAQYLMRWDASFDSRRCAQCASLDGQIIPLEGEFNTSWPVGSKGKQAAWSGLQPPAHPYCRCVLLPWKADWPDVEFSGQPPKGCM